MNFSKLFSAYFKIIYESIHPGDYINEMPLSKSAGLNHFKINVGHSSDRDDERLLSYEIGIKQLLNKFDELCYIVLSKYKNMLHYRFAWIFKYENSYYKIIVGFSNKDSAYFTTGYQISEKQFKNFSSYDGKLYIPKNGNSNFIILLKNN